jgi:molybdenum cofactor guanylyltransferase
MKTLHKIEAFVLSGGKSSRMGQDKGMLPLAGKPMVSHALDNIRQLGIPARIIANLDTYENLGLPVLKDVVAEKGPMGGLLTAMHFCKSSHFLLIGCDTPFIDSHAIEYLLSEMEGHAVTVAYSQGIMHPLFAVYSTSLKEEVSRRISLGELKMQDLIKSVIFKPAMMDDVTNSEPYLFFNCNDRKDMEEIQNYIESIKIKVLAFGVVAEILNSNDVYLPLVQDTDEMFQMLIENFPALSDVKFSIAVNRKLVHGKINLSKETEVALLPPFSGG